ncbi:three-helix bundle dimerization domain-containing protein [Sphaerisporangium dianthi]|uniref:Three-helix bundle dimerization domain-containing protein n=1 Tax=Sphaerisporangium dianthi TaxID=1436120 RepID=A0ABV9CE72_9ACTN
MDQLPDFDAYTQVETALKVEFAGVHPAATVTRCIEAAHHGAMEVTGYAYPSLVERIARKHLQVLATVVGEQG